MSETQATAPAKAKVEKVEEVVNMKDGRLVTFVGKRKMMKESFIGEDGSITIQIDFRNGETRKFVLPSALMAKFAAHGAEQKYGDETAGSEDIDDMVLAVDELDERIQKGEWTSRVEGNGLAGTSILIRALAEKTGKPVETIKGYLKTKSQKEKMALRNAPDIKPIVDRLEAEKVAKSTKVDTAGLVSELEAL